MYGILTDCGRSPHRKVNGVGVAVFGVVGMFGRAARSVLGRGIRGGDGE